MRTNAPTRVFVIGGLVGDGNRHDQALSNIAVTLGEQLGKANNIQLVVCSAHVSSVDAGVVKGFAKTQANQVGSVIVHCPLDVRPNVTKGMGLREQWEDLVKSVGLAEPHFRENSNARLVDDSGFSNAFLLCQIRALRQDTDVVIALGGKSGASAAQLLAIARDTYPIVPFAFMGGAAEQEYIHQEASIRSSVKSQSLIDSLQSPSGLKNVLDLIEGVRRVHGNSRIFMSYSWGRKEDADFVEAFLRRNQRVTIFRDEDEIQSGEPISGRIKQQIQTCDVFLALWCAEYATSPYCYDELQMALKLKQKKDIMVYILRLDDTRPVWPSLREPRTHNWSKKWLSPAESNEKDG